MPYKNKEDKIKYNKKYWKDNCQKLKIDCKLWKDKNKEKHKLSRRRYLENNRELINLRARLKYHKNEIARYKRLVRRYTILKYGKLDPVYCYHHNTEPYEVDKFDILPKDFHDFYHKNIEGGKLKK
jgi:hypothetical protein